MAITPNIKTAHEARIVGLELQEAAREVVLGLMMTGINDVNYMAQVLAQVGQDFLDWAGDKPDNEEVFIPTNRLAELDQVQAQVDTFIIDNFKI